MASDLDPKVLRRRFRQHLVGGLTVVWPILVGLLGVIVGLGVTVALIEHWPVFEGVYFAFVTGLTIGYGDLTPKTTVARTLAIGIGFFGILLGGLIAAVGVNALQATQQDVRSGPGAA